jgi:hypothetical protein
MRAVFVDGPWDGEIRKIDSPPAGSVETTTEGNSETIEVGIYNLVAQTNRGTAIYAYRGRK